MTGDSGSLLPSDLLPARGVPSMPMFRSKSVELEAKQYLGLESPSFVEIQEWRGIRFQDDDEYKHGFDRAEDHWTEPYDGITALLWNVSRGAWAPLRDGDWVVRSPDGVFTVVPAAEFAATFEPA